VRTHTPKTAREGSKTVKSDLKNASKEPLLGDLEAKNASNMPSEPPRERDSLAWNVTSEGKIDFSSMREKTKAKLRDIISDPEVARAVGANAANAGLTDSAHVDVFDPQWCGSIYDMISRLESWIVSSKFKLPYNLVSEALTYTPEEKALLVPPTAKVINKYAARWMVQFKDEIALIGLFSMITIGKIKALKEISQSGTVAPGKPEPLIYEPEKVQAEDN
jgi:hypothetical protein